ncbi:hypothetical protein DES53_101786 [Roseimicrobium gellanilyticum]|uniref:Uncharacterized protein n=2 Tax=Roseimicrobium gellanilyticum TaxID=748857 RepID=A0A366HUN3_9BACT|nr:hypothetical protein DES53_101786 [Roseimicrobium gellanilyticum]
MLLTLTLWTASVVADPPIVNKPSGAKVKTYGKPNSNLNTNSKPGFQTGGKGHRPPHVVVVPKPPVIPIRPNKTPQISGIATPFPDSSVKSYPTKVEVRPAQPPFGPAYPLTKFSQFGRPVSPFAAKPTVQQFLGPKPNASGITATSTPVPSAISTTKTVSSFTPAPRTVVPTHPSGFVVRSGHPHRPEKWQKVQDNCNTEWDSWHRKHGSHVKTIQGERLKNWGEVCGRYREPGWAKHFHGKEYKKWCGDVWKYRQDRCVEVWCDRKPFWNHVFDNNWWSSCWWRKSPPKHVIGAHESPWWWWHGCEPEKRRTFFGVALAVPAVIYDPGTTVLYDGSNYYVDGDFVSTAVAAREEVIDLANPDVSGILLPEPAPEGEAETWLPLGVWALAQQQQGDPTMFVQLSVNKDGIIAGAYKNILTGDEQPIVGRVDLKTQRIAWHVGDASQTVYETGLNSLDNDVASVFIHFGTEATQTWLLVKLPSPEMPPGPVKTPRID